MYVVAVDPGREKCGIALLGRDGTLYDKRVVRIEEVYDRLAAYRLEFGRFALVVGDRTGSKEFITQLERHRVRQEVDSVTRVDEHMTTLEARRRYFEANPPKGLRRMIPRTMQTPPVPYDDWVAVILAERYLAEGGGRA